MISIVIPMYNSEKTIERALDSVINQTYQGKYQIIIINDGSTDSSLDIVKKYRKNLNKKNIEILIMDEKNGGVSKARNIGIKKSEGRYIALLDSDDEWLCEKLKIQIDILNKNSDIDFLGCERNGEKTKILFKKIEGLTKISLKDLIIKTCPQTSTAIFKKEILEEVGYYDETQRYSEDSNLWLRICAKKNFYMISDNLVITDGGKPNFGHSGLSANLLEMERGSQKNLEDLLKLKYISKKAYYIYKTFYRIKYIRRCIIAKLRGI